MYATQRIQLNTALARFERNWNLLPVGVGDLTGSVYVDSGAAWNRGETIKQLTGIGGQIQLDFKLGYNYSLPVTLGYAKGLDDVKGRDYVYLNFGSSY